MTQKNKMDEEIRKVLKDMQDRIDTLENEVSELKNHKHDSDGFATGNY